MPATRRCCRRQLAVGESERVVRTRVEVRELVDPVEDVPDQLLEVEPRSQPGAAAETAGQRGGELPQVRVVDRAGDPVRVGGVGGEQVPYPLSDLDQRVGGEAGQADLHRPRVVEPGLGGESIEAGRSAGAAPAPAW